MKCNSISPVFLIRYFKQHWQGQLPLNQALWVNLIALSIMLYTVSWMLLQITLKSSPPQLINITVYFLIFQYSILCWQIIGLIRTTERYLSECQQSGLARVAQFGVLISIASLLVWSITIGQSLLNHRVNLVVKQHQANLKPDYTLLVKNNQLQINGFLSPGITREVKHILLKNPSISRLVLNSTGGNIYEARGLAKIILKNRLGTHSSTGCYSACTTAFIAGIKRTLNHTAKLGFHQYKLDSKVLLPPDTNPKIEQQTDLIFYKEQGIDTEFLKQVFSRHHNQIWEPDKLLLLAANVIHAITLN